MRFVAAAGVALSWGVLAAPAAAVSGTWGPDAIPYTNGVLCENGDRTTALVSWPTTAGDQPAFALRPVTSTGGRVDVPAVAPTATAPLTVLTDEQQAGLAYLATHEGASADEATVADVAAITASETACLDQGIPGVDAGTTQQLTDRALALGGPYTVTVGADAPLVLDAPGRVYADVRSATGTAVPGMTVTFTADGASVDTATAQTDDSGRAGANLLVPMGSDATAVAVRATVSAPVTMLELTAPGAVPLTVPGPDEPFEGRASVPVDTSADPVARLRVTPSPAIPGMPITAVLDVTGMRGHDGTAGLRRVGPLPFRDGSGCTGYHEADWKDAPASDAATGLAISGDSSRTVQLGVAKGVGCFLLQARVDTVNAKPAVTAYSDPDDAAAVLAVAPLQVSVVAATHGVALPGPLRATVTVDGDTPASVERTTGTVLGPRLARRGTCPTTGWTGTSTVATLTGPAGDDTSHAEVSSRALATDGCYLLQLQPTLDLPGIGSISVPQRATRVLALDPQFVVTALSAHGVSPGSRVQATVSVLGTLTQPGTLRLGLARLADDAGGCFGRDYSTAPVVDASQPPSTATRGDGTYSVQSPPVPSTGCWTVVPQLTLDAGGLRVNGTPGTHTMVAFTAVDPAQEDALGGTTVPTGGTLRYVLAGVLALVLLVAALFTTVRLAVRSATAR